MDGSPPVFEQIFRNARFAQGGNAFFEGKVRGNPQPQLSWTREGRPLSGNDRHLQTPPSLWPQHPPIDCVVDTESAKYQMKYEPTTGNVSLLISSIGPGDEGEYTCTAVNQFGEAICTVYIQPEGRCSQRFLSQVLTRSLTYSAASGVNAQWRDGQSQLQTVEPTEIRSHEMHGTGFE